MSLFQRAHDIVAAKTNKALDAAEKPDEMLDLSYDQMLEQITRVRQALVDIAASRKQIELQETQLQHSVDHLQDQAKARHGHGGARAGEWLVQAPVAVPGLRLLAWSRPA
jgi:phage shock protein A